MVKGLYTAYTGMKYQQEKMDVISNNLANSATVGFKREGATAQTFKDVLAVKIKDASEAFVDKGIGDMSMGVHFGETYRDYSQGSIKQTSSNTDVALEGSGFFTISYTNKAGETSQKYTRDGSFILTQEGYLTTKDGDFVLGNNSAPIQLDPAAEVQIDSLGRIFQNDQFVNQLRIVDVEDTNYLKKFGENLYELTEGGAETESQASVRQSYLEQSNVQVVSEMVELITVTRAYEANQKMIQNIDNTLDKSVNTVGRV